MAKSHGTRRKSRSALSKKVRDKGRIPLSRLLVKYAEGDKVVINVDSGVHKAMPHKRFQGKVALITGTRGKAFIMEIPQRKTVKTIITTAEHIRMHRDA
jgi:large subunit ribosomal protein L21e